MLSLGIDPQASHEDQPADGYGEDHRNGEQALGHAESRGCPAPTADCIVIRLAEITLTEFMEGATNVTVVIHVHHPRA